jgi:subtilase family serine protease
MNCALKVILVILIVSGFLADFSCAANERYMLKGHVPDAVAQLQPIGRLDGAFRMKLAIGLAPRDEKALDAFVQQVSDQASPSYHHYLTPAQFAEEFGPTKNDYQTLIDYAKTNGLTVTRQYLNRVVLDVEGPVSAIENIFQVRMMVYQHPTEARTFYAPDVEPSVDLGVSLLHIEGLDNYTRPRPKHERRSLNRGGSSGQNLGLVEFEDYYPSDISSYEAAIGLSNAPQLVVVTVDTAATQNDEEDNGEECSGDIEMAVSMAPGLKAIYVFEDGLTVTNPHFDDIFESILTYTNVLQFSCSWGGSTAADPTSEVLFKQMAMQGQSFFDATGDAGAFVGNVQFPSDSPSITQVGGTTMTDGGAPNYPWLGEVVWAWDSGPNVSGRRAISSAGGISTYYGIPYWQTNISMAANGGSASSRNFPDVAANADNCYLYTDDGLEGGGWGGTSFAAPLWAAFTALVNQQAASNGRAPVGFLNPGLYALASGTNYLNLFHDITSGNNTWRGSPGEFYATAGYDLCTGLGTMNGTNLINALAPPVPAPSFLPLAPSGGNIKLSWSTVSAVSYQLQYNSDLTTTNWINLGSVITASNTVTTANDSLTNSQRFYRVMVVP